MRHAQQTAGYLPVAEPRRPGTSTPSQPGRIHLTCADGLDRSLGSVAALIGVRACAEHLLAPADGEEWHLVAGRSWFLSPAAAVGYAVLATLISQSATPAQQATPHRWAYASWTVPTAASHRDWPAVMMAPELTRHVTLADWCQAYPGHAEHPPGTPGTRRDRANALRRIARDILRTDLADHPEAAEARLLASLA